MLSYSYYQYFSKNAMPCILVMILENNPPRKNEAGKII
jgi:hypothetical protein